MNIAFILLTEGFRCRLLFLWWCHGDIYRCQATVNVEFFSLPGSYCMKGCSQMSILLQAQMFGNSAARLERSSASIWCCSMFWCRFWGTKECLELHPKWDAKGCKKETATEYHGMWYAVIMYSMVNLGYALVQSSKFWEWLLKSS